MRTTRLGILGVVVAAGALVLSGAPAMASVTSMQWSKAYTCTGGEIPSGHYASITVTGVCSVVPNAKIRVAGNVNVWPGATLDAQSAPSKITVEGNVTAFSGSLLGLGCQAPPPSNPTSKAFHPCKAPHQGGHSKITVNGNVTTIDASLVLLNGITVHGNVTLLGGGGQIPWSIKHNTIGRNLTVIGQTTNWVGVLFNKIGGNATLLFITITDTDPGAHGAFVVQNKIGRNLICYAVTPTVSGTSFPGEALNQVRGHAFG